MDEFTERVGQAYQSRTWADLTALTADLPSLSVAPAGGEPPDQATTSQPATRNPHRLGRMRNMREQLAGLAIADAVCVSVWAMSGAHGSFWPEWVLLGTGIVALRRITGRGRHHHRRERRGLGYEPPGELTQASRWEREGRFFAALAFSDIVDSTKWAMSLGDQKWATVLNAYRETADRAVRDWSGRVVFRRGDEVVVAFDSPARAVQWACAVRAGAHALNLDTRSGVHAGELETHDGEVSGVGLHIGQRVASAAEPGEVLVTSTVKELIVGSNISLTDRGQHELRGLDEPWHLFSVVN